MKRVLENILINLVGGIFLTALTLGFFSLLGIIGTILGIY